MTILDHALAWHLRGYVPLPLATDGTKRPGVPTWKAFQQERPDIAAVVQMFTTDTDGIGVLTGSPSGGLEMLEFEGRAIAEGLLPKLVAAFDAAGLRALWDRIAGGYVERTPSGGVHYHYRVAGDAAPNTKLARRPSTAEELEQSPQQRIQVLIETRGEGGFTVVAPSAGRSHPSGEAWTVLAGSMDTIPTLTAQERDTIHAIARTLDKLPAAERPAPRPTAPSGAEPGGDRPGDDYNARGNWDVLVRHGWRVCKIAGGTTYWTRPGKEVSDGVSATTGHSDDGVDRLWVFSSSTEFEPDTPYSRLAVLAELEHGGDFAAAAKALAKQGYGSSSEQIVIPIDRGPMAPAPSNVVPIRPEPATTPTLTDGSTAIAAEIAESREPIAIELARYGPTEDGLARALVARYRDVLRFCPQRGLWLAWNGSRWAWDESELHREHARTLARQLPDNDDWKRFRAKMLSAAGIAGVVRLARSDEVIAVHIDDLDAHTWELNTPGGIINLRTGRLGAADRAQLHTRSTTVTPDFEAPAPVWRRFLADTFGGDAELIGYVQRLLGVSAVGQVHEQLLPFAFGSGANGKSTLMNVVTKVLGRGRDGYSTALDSEALMVRRHSEHPAELAQLAGARLVVSSEIEDGQRFAEARVKQLTGGDAISARFMRGNPFTFTPTHTIWLVGNHRPGASSGPAIMRRIKTIPFEHVVPEEHRDPHLEDKLVAEAPQILAWVARGAAAYAAAGIDAPAAVENATEAYRDEQDSVGRFVTECCMKTPAGRVRVAELRAAYERFCHDVGDTPVSAKRFGEQLRDAHGIELKKSTGGVRTYVGVALYADDDDPTGSHWSDR